MYQVLKMEYGLYNRQPQYIYAYYDFNEDGYIEYYNEDNNIIEKNGEFISTTGKCCKHSFLERWVYYFNSRNEWDDVEVTIIDDNVIFTIEGNNKQYIYVEFPTMLRIYIEKEDLNKILSMYSQRNAERHSEKNSICSYIDKTILDIAENLLNIVEEDIMLNYRVVARCHNKYSHVHVPEEIINKNSFLYSLSKDTGNLKCKEKKEAEKFNDELQKKTFALSEVIDNFVEIITEAKKIKPYIARAVAWEAIQRKTIEYYAQKWEEEYEVNLEEKFDELANKMNEKNIDVIKRVYIQSVILCDEIDIDHSQEILMYFLISKGDVQELVLYDCFVKNYELIREIRQNVHSDDIKQKLKTKQKRRITKYTIDDVDLMNGEEFEEFVCMLFKKMGYSSQVTKQSGDQGLDVIAVRNGTKIGVQAKCYSNTVGNSAVQEAVAGKSFYNCDKVIVITNNYFTPAAMELAQSNGVILWNRDMLKEKIKELM